MDEGLSDLGHGTPFHSGMVSSHWFGRHWSGGGSLDTDEQNGFDRISNFKELT